MFFNSIDFIIYLPTVFILYWFVTNSNLKNQNFLIVVASYFFYGWWDWKFLSLILVSTSVDFTIGNKLNNEEDQLKRKILIWVSILVNLGILGFFKYYNFFIENFYSAFSFFGYKFHGNSLNIILPVGISFYTFQTLSYTIDVYKRKLEPTNDFISFSAFVSFFPQLVAGPIERASNLLPQFQKIRKFEYAEAVDGMRQILWGFFKKIVIADNCALYANHIFNNSSDMSGSTLVLGALFFSFQIYGDFSGYSDIAIGTARLFGFKLMKNFDFPYFSRDIAEFWRRWHISLSTWFRDYVYIPLGGSRVGTLNKIRNIFIIFILSGLWHGANWTFIVWGLLNAIYFIPLMLTNKNRNNIEIVSQGKYFPTLKELLLMLMTFGLTVFAWIFFRAEHLSHAFGIINEIFSVTFFKIPYYPGLGYAKSTIVLIIFFLIVEWLGRENNHVLERIDKSLNNTQRKLFYLFIVHLMVLFGTAQEQFIYFQF